MDKQKKPFDAVWIVLLLIIALFNDAGTVFFLILASTGIGLTGEAIMVPINLFMAGFFTIVFFMKCGFGGPAIIQMGDSALEIVGVPGRTLSIIAGIIIANTSFLRKAAQVEAALATGDAEGLEEAGEAVEGATAETEAAIGTETGEGSVQATGGEEPIREVSPEKAEAETEASRETPKEAAEKEQQERAEGLPSEEGEEETGEEDASESEEKKKKDEDIEKELEAPAERPPEEEAEQQDFEEIPGTQDGEEEEDDENEEEKSEQVSQAERSAPSSPDEFARKQKAVEVRQQQQRTKPLQRATGEQDEDTFRDQEAA